MRGIVIENGTSALVDDLEVRDVQPHEVKVAVQASGLCRSDLLLEEFPDPRPTVRGHEAAGIVEEVGSAVTGLEVGQRVAVTCQRPCMRCAACARGLYTACPTGMDDPAAPFSRGGRPVRSFARSSSLAEHIVVDELQAHPIGDDLGMAGAALIGCAVSTGVGMVRNLAQLKPGQSVAVFGVGGIGINSIQAARLGGAGRVIAADINPAKEDLARRFGADAFVAVDPQAGAAETAEHILSAIGCHVDVVVEATGQPTMIRAGLSILEIGGTLAQVGIPTRVTDGTFGITDLMMRHLSIRGALNGATNPFTDPQVLVQAAQRGDLELASQVTHRFPLEEYDAAFDALKSGAALRVVVEVGSAG
ncbi:zinc-binding dehydrogenase [Streptomyces sp. NPDC056190]|uniref:zinc-binding dehydrogenase n=1 Tax=Streptomyces sp. NPDC056190 TaxID=3345741 RepID=UPI0035D57BA7